MGHIARKKKQRYKRYNIRLIKLRMKKTKRFPNNRRPTLALFNATSIRVIFTNTFGFENVSYINCFVSMIEWLSSEIEVEIQFKVIGYLKLTAPRSRATRNYCSQSTK